MRKLALLVVGATTVMVSPAYAATANLGPAQLLGFGVAGLAIGVAVGGMANGSVGAIFGAVIGGFAGLAAALIFSAH